MIAKLILYLLTALILHADNKPPNFILIYVDDLGYADSSVQMMSADPTTKHRFIQTPGLERLAKMGTRYTAAYSPTPTCTGSRMSIMHGQSSAKLHYRNVFDVYSNVQRPDGYRDEITLGEMMKDTGLNYHTAHLGKGCGNIGRLDENGFDLTDEYPGEVGGNGNAHGQYCDPVKEKAPFPPDNPKRMHSLRKDAAENIRNNAGKQPFFMVVSHYAPHIPFMCTEGAFERTRQRWLDGGGTLKDMDNPKSEDRKMITYAAMIEEMDMTVTDVLDALEETGELENTYIIFTSDNGGGKTEIREVDGIKRRFNGPLQEGKRSIFEGGIRVPTVMAGPGIKAGAECHVPIVQWDFMPTFHDLSGSKGPLPPNIDGGSLRDVIKNGNKGSVQRVAPGIIHHYTCHYHAQISSLIIGDYKLMRHLTSGELRLYNIQTDYREEHDLSQEMPELVTEMDTIRQQYVDDVKGGEVQDVREAYYALMDTYAQQAKDQYKKKVAALGDTPEDEAEKTQLLTALNKKLLGQAIGKEFARRMEHNKSWRDGEKLKPGAKAHIEAQWTDYTGQ